MFKLLLVEDETLDREGMKKFLAGLDMGISQIKAARNGFEALEIVKDFTPDILVTDIKMPGISGLELAEKLKTRFPSLKILLISGHSDFAFARNAIKLEAFDYLLKPVDDEELKEALIKIVSRIKEERLINEKARELLGLPDDESDPSMDIIKIRNIIIRVLKYVEENYKRDITLKEIATELFYSPNHLGCIFKEETGQTFSEYLNEYRMKKAGQLLRDPTVKTYEVANLVGYNNANPFIKQFKQYYGLTPREFRDR